MTKYTDVIIYQYDNPYGNDSIYEFLVAEYPNLTFGLWSEEAVWVRKPGEKPEINYGYSNHGPYWEMDPDIYWDVLEKPLDATVIKMSNYREIVEEVGLDVNHWKKH